MDYFATQLTGTPCAPFNCAAASGAMGLAFGSANRDIVSADAFRAQAAVSCVPGAHSQSGGLFISDVERVYALHDIRIDYGRDANGLPRRWDPAALSGKLLMGHGAVVLGDYDALPAQYRASATFRGDHSAWVHDYHASDKTVCWHDPLRHSSMHIPISAVISYWQKPTSPIRGYAGFVPGVEEPMPDLNYGAERWKLDGTTLVTSIGAPRRADGTSDPDIRYVLFSGTAGALPWTIQPIPRSRLTAVSTDLSDEFFRALTGYTLGADQLHTITVLDNGVKRAEFKA